MGLGRRVGLLTMFGLPVVAEAAGETVADWPHAENRGPDGYAGEGLRRRTSWMPRAKDLLTLVATCGLTLIGCASVKTALLCHGCIPPTSGVGGAIEVRFLGVAGFLIRRDDQAILTAPLFSNPSFLAVGLGRIGPNQRRVQAGLHRVHLSPSDLDQVRGVLVGHAHYDHLMDVPVLCPAMPKATVFGSQTVENILKAFPSCCKVRVVDDKAVGYEDPRPDANWIEVIPEDPRPEGHGAVRILALKSEHSAQFEVIGARFNFHEGAQTEPQQRPPTKASQWFPGPIYAYLIDFLGKNKNVEFRIHYVDSPSCAPCGYVPKAIADDHAVDLAILNVGGSKTMADYPDGILKNLCAQHVLLSHWENLFKPYESKEGLEVLGDSSDFLAHVQAQGFDACFPVPGSSFWYTPATVAVSCHWDTYSTARHCGCRVEKDGRCEPVPDHSPED